MVRVLSLILLACLPLAGMAAVYKWTAPDGTVIYSDRPPSEDAKATRLPDVQTMEFRSIRGEETPKPDRAPSAITYTDMRIVSPAQDITIHDNAGKVDVDVNLTPALKTDEGHSITLVMDGTEVVTQSVSLKFILQNVDRGSHTLEAKVVDGEGVDVISTPVITFHLQRAIVKRPNP
jgi:hypothetical protein